MSWDLLRAREHFPEFSGLWNGMNRACGNHLLLDAAFVGPLIDCFSDEGTLLAVSKDSTKPGFALLNKVRNGFWSTFQPSQAPIGLVLLKRGEAAREQVDGLLRSLPGFALSLSVLQQDPEWTSFENLSPSRRVELLTYIETARVRLVGSFNEFLEGRSKILLQNINRRYRALARQGIEAKLVIRDKPAEMIEAVQTYGRIETKGWKGKEGTALAANNLQGLFYQRTLQGFAEKGEAQAYELHFNDSVVASDLCLSRGGTQISLKITYDEDYRRFSPGVLLRFEIYKSLYKDGRISTIEFYGRVRDFQLEWTKDVRKMVHISFYRNEEIGGLMSLLRSMRAKAQKKFE